jgi:hypothetical protein
VPELTLAESAPFVASTLFAFAGSPFSSSPWQAFEAWVDQRRDEVLAVGGAEAEAIVQPDVVRRRAESAAASSGLPRSAAMTAIGIWVAFAGFVAVLGGLAVVGASVAVQRTRNSISYFKIARWSVPRTTAALVALNIGGLLLALRGP